MTLALFMNNVRSWAAAVGSLRARLPHGILTRLINGTVWLTIGTGIGQILKLVSFVFIAQVLTRDDVGRLGSIQNTIFTISNVAVLGLGVTTSKLVGEFRSNEKQRAGRVIRLANIISFWTSVSIASLLVMVASPFASIVWLAPQLDVDFQIGSLLLLASTVNSVQVGTLTGLNAFGAVSAVAICQGVLSLVFGYLGALFYGQRGVLVGLVVALAMCCAVAKYCVERECAVQRIPLRCGDWVQERGMVWNFAFPSLLASLLSAPSYWMAQAVLARQEGGFGELALFSVAFQWRVVLLFIPSVLARVLVPILSELESRKDVGGGFRTTLFSLLVLSVICSLAASVIIIWSPEILRSYGPSYVGAQRVFVLVIIGSVISAVNGMISANLSSINRIWTLTLANALLSLGGLLLSLWLIPRFLATGLALAFLIGECLYFAVVLSAWIGIQQDFRNRWSVCWNPKRNIRQ